ncbi:hypothetical protein [Haloplanus halobius]|uniref:hypothetical protein n=1 Tax=Haloplanus halobius TaxID=2934938 RepID=UPI00200FDA6D|nr:hypothetical protein [Haloplanus sp. XH21]
MRSRDRPRRAAQHQCRGGGEGSAVGVHRATRTRPYRTANDGTLSTLVDHFGDADYATGRELEATADDGSP